MSTSIFSCTLLCDYPPEDLWSGYVVFGECLPCGRVVLSEYREKTTQVLGAIFEQNARQGVHFSAEGEWSQRLAALPKFEAVRNKPGQFKKI